MKNNFEPSNTSNLDYSFNGVLGRLYSVTPSSISQNIYDSDHLDVEEDSDEDDFENIGGRRKEAKALGLKGKAFRQKVKELRKEDKGLSKEEKKEKKQNRKQNYNKALVEGKILKGKNTRKVKHSILKFAPTTIAIRGAMLSLLSINIVGIAKSFSLIKENKNQLYWKQIQEKWYDWGGDKKALDKAVEKGKNKKPLFKAIVEKRLKKKSGFDGLFSNAGGNGADTAGNIVAGSAALMGVAAGVLALLPPEPVTKTAATALSVGAGGFGAMSPIIKSFAKNNGATPEQLSSIPNPPKDNTNPDNIPVIPPTDPAILEMVVKDIKKSDDTIWGMNKYLVIGGAVVVLIGGFLLVKHMMKVKLSVNK